MELENVCVFYWALWLFQAKIRELMDKEAHFMQLIEAKTSALTQSDRLVGINNTIQYHTILYLGCLLSCERGRPRAMISCISFETCWKTQKEDARNWVRIARMPARRSRPYPMIIPNYDPSLQATRYCWVRPSILRYVLHCIDGIPASLIMSGIYFNLLRSRQAIRFLMLSFLKLAFLF